MNKLLLIFNLISLVFSEPLITKNIVDYINSKQNFWIANYSTCFNNYTLNFLFPAKKPVFNLRRNPFISRISNYLSNQIIS